MMIASITSLKINSIENRIKTSIPSLNFSILFYGLSFFALHFLVFRAKLWACSQNTSKIQTILRVQALEFLDFTEVLCLVQINKSLTKHL